MENRTGQEKEFMDGVWRKIRYLEFKRNADERLRKRRRDYSRRRMKTALSLLVGLALVSAVFFATVRINTYTLILLGSIYMGAGLFYEFLPGTPSGSGR